MNDGEVATGVFRRHDRTQKRMALYKDASHFISWTKHKISSTTTAPPGRSACTLSELIYIRQQTTQHNAKYGKYFKYCSRADNHLPYPGNDPRQ
jgi:hypothetical protein